MQTRLMGSPPIVIASAGFSLYLGYQWSEGADVLLLLIPSIGATMAATKASEEIQAYRAWKQKWDAFGGTVSQARRRPPFIAFIFIALLSLFLSVPKDGQALMLLAAVTLAGIFGSAWLVRKLLGRKRRPVVTAVQPVAVVVAGPLIPVPRFSTIPLALPEYCRRVLADPQS